MLVPVTVETKKEQNNLCRWAIKMGALDGQDGPEPPVSS